MDKNLELSLQKKKSSYSENVNLLLEIILSMFNALNPYHNPRFDKYYFRFDRKDKNKVLIDYRKLCSIIYESEKYKDKKITFKDVENIPGYISHIKIGFIGNERIKDHLLFDRNVLFDHIGITQL